MSSFKLQKYIRELSELNWVHYTDTQNILLNGKWVTDIDKGYFEESANGIKEFLRDDTLQGLSNEVKTSLTRAKNKALKMWDDIVTGKYYHERKTISPSHPIYTTSYFLQDKEQEERKYVVFDSVVELLKLDSKKFGENDLHSYLLSLENNSEKDINFHYAYGHLSYVLLILVETIDDLLQDLEGLDEPEHLSPMKKIFDNPYSIEFNLTKMDIAYFFYILYEEGIIKTEGKNEKNRKTHLKKYIDNANIFYTDDNKKTQVNRINKEFTKVEQPKLYGVVGKEKLFLEELVSKLQNRLNKLQGD